MQTVFLDACAVIYWLEARDPWYSRLQDTLRSLREQYSDLQLSVSDLSQLECLVKPLRDQQRETVALYEQFFQHPQSHIQPLTPQVVRQALKLRVSYKIKTPDALQAASALVFDAQAIFLTADHGFEQLPDLAVQLFDTSTSPSC